MRKPETLPPSCAVVMKSGSLNFLEPSGPLQACKGLLYLYMNDSTRVVYCVRFYCITFVTPCKFYVAANWSCHTKSLSPYLLRITDRKPNATCTSSHTSKDHKSFLPVDTKHKNGLSPSPLFTDNDTLFSTGRTHNLGTRGTDK